MRYNRHQTSLQDKETAERKSSISRFMVNVKRESNHQKLTEDYLENQYRLYILIRTNKNIKLLGEV